MAREHTSPRLDPDFGMNTYLSPQVLSELDNQRRELDHQRRAQEHPIRTATADHVRDMEHQAETYFTRAARRSLRFVAENPGTVLAAAGAITLVTFRASRALSSSASRT